MNIYKKKGNIIFFLLLNIVIFAANKPNTKRNKTAFILHSLDVPTLNIGVKKNNFEISFLR